MLEPTAMPVVYQLRIFLRGISPMVWRRLLVRSDSSIADLHYIFTDGWLNEIRVERILPLEPQRAYPICVSGQRAVPPEAYGGARAYMTVRQQLKFRAVFGYTLHELLEREWEEKEVSTEDPPQHDPDHFARHDVNARLDQYARGDRDSLFEEEWR